MRSKDKKKLSGVAVVLALLIAGCSKEDSSSTPVAPTPDNTAQHPTTQQLLTGPRSSLDLKFVPFTLQVPGGWEVQSFNQGLVATVNGQTPDDVVSISLSTKRTVSTDQEKALEQHAQQDLALHADLLPKLGVQDIGGAKVIEHLVVDQPTTQEAATPATTGPIQTLQWTFTACIPTADGKGFTAYDLRFLGMTLAQYKADQAFLRSIMDSLKYVPSSDTLSK